MCFEGIAGKWHCFFMAHMPPLGTYDRRRAKLLRAFKPVNYEDHLEIRFRTRAQGIHEPFRDYFHDVLYLWAQIDPLMSEKTQKIKHLYRGLKTGRRERNVSVLNSHQYYQ